MKSENRHFLAGVAAVAGCLVLALALAGCGRGVKLMHEPSQAEMASWNYGPFPENYKEIVLASPRIKTLDPAGTRYEFQGAPQKKWATEGAGFIYGWTGTIKSFGNVTGSKTYEYFIRDGQLLRVLEENDRRFLRI